MRYTSSWFDKGPSTSVAATRPCISMVAVGIFMVAALALGWTTTAAAYDELPRTGQTTCYQLERYPVGHPFEGEAVLRDANGTGDPEFDLNTGEPTPLCDTSTPEPCFDPATANVNDQVLALCAGTGQDGESQKGIARTRIDKGDGRIYDNNTGLTWAKKSDDDGLHDKDNTYTWEEAFKDYIHTMNNSCHLSQIGSGTPIACTSDAQCAATAGGPGGPCGFAGKRDWRLPNVRELSSLVNWGVFSNDLSPTPTVWPEFNYKCVRGVATVLTGSCTHSDDVIYNENPDATNDGDLVEFGTMRGPLDDTSAVLRVPMTYWSSTSGDVGGDAWFVDFFTGDSGAHFKDADLDIDNQIDLLQGAGAHNAEVIFAGHVRAVRGPGDDDPAPKPAPAPKPPKKKK